MPGKHREGVTALESEGKEQARALSVVKAKAELSQDIRSSREVLNRKAPLHSLNTRIPSFNSSKTITSLTPHYFEANDMKDSFPFTLCQ